MTEQADVLTDDELREQTVSLMPDGSIIREYVRPEDVMKRIGYKAAAKQLVIQGMPTANRAERRRAGKGLAKKLKRSNAK